MKNMELARGAKNCMEFNMVYQGIVYSTFSPTVEKVFMK